MARGSVNYLRNPLIHRERRMSGASSAWQRSFSCESLRPLIICRGPIRKEAMDTFEEMGIHEYAILLSEKDSFAFPSALAPELRILTDPSRVFRVSDYSGATGEERSERVSQIISICTEHGYDSVFAGYGFMAEDEELVQALEDAGLIFIGPGSTTQRRAGRKDEAKRTAIEAGVQVIPGIDNVTALTLLAKAGDAEEIVALCRARKVAIDEKQMRDASLPLEERADIALEASYAAGVDLISIDELCAQIAAEAGRLQDENGDQRIRLKGVFGGGGKGQRILPPLAEQEGSGDARRRARAERIGIAAREILAELKCNGVGDNKNILIELNVDATRHHEIQVVGNGAWCVTLGGRDCSVQMHEQKLIEAALTVEGLEQAIGALEAGSRDEAAESLKRDLRLLEEMESEGAAFGAAVGLDSVSTFECIVSGDHHYFMEMNTRVQVEHRVTELCYALRFTNPDEESDYFEVMSLVEAMVLLAKHGPRLPEPTRVRREPFALEVRLNATNQALRPNAGGLIEEWSEPLPLEVRDDQGICLHNPDTGRFMRYHLAGAYDSNIALLLTTGADRQECYERMAEVLRKMELRGRDLETNLDFHYGLINWLLGEEIHAQPDTGFVTPYLAAVGRLKQVANGIALDRCYDAIVARHLEGRSGQAADRVNEVLERKRELLLRPLRRLFDRPHLLAGWLARAGGGAGATAAEAPRTNPIETLITMYHYLNMDYVAGRPAAHMIWDHDRELLAQGTGFYASLGERLGVQEFAALERKLAGRRPAAITKELWEQARAAHIGFQAGTEILGVIDFIAAAAGFGALRVKDDLTVAIPAEFDDAELQRNMGRVLVPPLQIGTDTIVAESGGMFYSRETPESEPFVTPGSHFEAGDPIYIIEVMKMFNRVHAPFAGTIERVLVEADGVVIKKGQPIFAVVPDEFADGGESDGDTAEDWSDRFLATLQ